MFARQFTRRFGTATHSRWHERSLPRQVATIGQRSIPWRWLHSNPELIHLRRPAPTLGEHNVEVYVEELGSRKGELEIWEADGLV